MASRGFCQDAPDLPPADGGRRDLGDGPGSSQTFASAGAGGRGSPCGPWPARPDSPRRAPPSFPPPGFLCATPLFCPALSCWRGSRLPRKALRDASPASIPPPLPARMAEDPTRKARRQARRAPTRKAASGGTDGLRHPVPGDPIRPSPKPRAGLPVGNRQGLCWRGRGWIRSARGRPSVRATFRGSPIARRKIPSRPSVSGRPSSPSPSCLPLLPLSPPPLFPSSLSPFLPLPLLLPCPYGFSGKPGDLWDGLSGSGRRPHWRGGWAPEGISGNAQSGEKPG